MPLAAVPKWLLLLCVLLVLSCCTRHVHGATSQLEAMCGANVKGHCNECICCCYRGAVPAYKPDGCQCQVSLFSTCTCYDCPALSQCLQVPVRPGCDPSLPCPVQAVYGPAFGFMIGIAVATLVCSIANGLYFVSNPLRPRRFFSPFPLEPLYKTFDEREAFVL